MGIVCGAKKYEELTNIPENITFITLKTLEGVVLDLKDLKSEYKSPILIVNISRTSPDSELQLTQLQTLYDDYKDKGFEILAFECHQFLKNKPERISFTDISEKYKSNWGVTFKIFPPMNVNGQKTHPIFRYLRYQKQAREGETDKLKLLKGCFHKYLLNKDMNFVGVYKPKVEPLSMRDDIEKF